MAAGVRGGGGASTGRDTRDHSGPSGGGSGKGSDFGQGGRGGRSSTPRGGGGASTGRDNRANQGPVGGNQGRGSQTFSGTNYSDARDDPVAKENTARNQDAQNIGESWGDGAAGIGNELAHMFGGFLGLGEREEDFTETAMDMARPEYNGPVGGPGTGGTRSANWGLDPVGAVVGLGSSLAGLPAGPGMIADWISEQFGRPLDINLGSSVLETEDDPITGQTASRTHTGSGMTVRDAGDSDTYLGVSPMLGYTGEGASRAMPSNATYTGTNPTAQEPAESDPFTPVTPQPTQTGTMPQGMNVDVGNSGLTAQQLSDLFAGFMGKSSRKAPASVIV
jgi:hypothetical protein